VTEMDTTNDILELKFEGSEINPSNVKPSEIAELISNFEKALLVSIKEDSEIDTNEILFTFEEIANRSLDLLFKPKPSKNISNDTFNNSYRKLSKRISESDFDGFSNEGLIALRGICKFTRKHKCVGSFRLNNETLSSITPTTEISIKQPLCLKGETTIYGELIDVGGDNPNIHIKINEDYIIIVDTNREIAKKLGNRLFDTIGLNGYAKWEIETSKILEFKLSSILDYNPIGAKESFQQLKGITSGVWDNYNSNQEINNRLLRD